MRPGKVYKVPCNQVPGEVYCKTMPWGIDNFYHFTKPFEIESIDFDNYDPIYAMYIHKSVYKELIPVRKEQITEKERNSIPRFFRQDFFDLNYCHLVIPGQPDAIPCKPEDCIGLERASVHDELCTLCEELNFKITGVRPRDYEQMRLRIPGIDEPFDFSVKL
jgi:hypothetical protein